IARCLVSPVAAGQTFLASDGDDVSTADLVVRLAVAMGKPARLFPIPTSFSRKLFQLAHKADTWQRLFGSLQVDAGKTRKTLGWCPIIALHQGLSELGCWYMRR